MKTKSVLITLLIFSIGVNIYGEGFVTVRDINKEAIQSNFLKFVTVRPADLNLTDPTKPIYTTQETTGPIPLYGIDQFPQEFVFTTLNRQNLQPSKPCNCCALSISKTKGNFVLVLVFGLTNNYEMSTGWLFTYDYYGHRVDSLECYRQFESNAGYLSDLNTCINSDLTIRQTFIDWGVPISNLEIIGNGNKIGTRYDLEYIITPTGHFIETPNSRIKYESKTYTAQDLLISDETDINHSRGIHRGKEQSLGIVQLNDRNSSTNDMQNRFPIYGGIGR